MRAERWHRVKDLFAQAVERPPDERGPYLDEACGDDAELRDEIESLLRAHEADDGFIERPAIQIALGHVPDLHEAPQVDWIGRRLGVYRVVEEVGSGGMSIVYRAVRDDDEYQADVAIKVLRQGFDIGSLLRRFRREKQILATLDHPGIARLRDAGSTPEGLPYIVMDFIQGLSIDEYCYEHRLGIAARLALFRELCGAVEYVHQHLMVHGDLKCHNVLVTGRGAVKLLDFGIARLLAPGVPGAADGKATSLVALTPEYASPEQVRGQPITTTSDVYSLGVVLYRLLAGVLPYSVGAERSYELATQICEREPLSPSLAARRNSGTQDPIDWRDLAGDLDNIVMLALRKEPAKRYSSVEQLSADVQRHLQGFPVAARGTGVGYKLAKFVGRHPLGVAVSVLLMLAALGGLWRIVYERDRARQAESVAHTEAENSKQIADYLISMFEAASPERVGAASILPQDIVDRSRRELDVRLAHQPAQRARALAALGRIYLQLWQVDAAEQTLLEAVRLERTRGESAQLAEYLYVLGYVYGFSGRPAQAIPVLAQAIAVQQRTQPGNHAALADQLSTLGLAQARTGQAQVAIATIEEALVHAAASDGPAGKRVGESLYALARAQLNAGDQASAEASAQRSLAILRAQLPPDAPSALSALTTLAAVTEAKGRPAAAEVLLREALDRQLKTLDPGSFWAVTVRNSLARVIAAQGRKLEAVRLYEENRMHLIRKHAQGTPAYREIEAHLADLGAAGIHPDRQD